MAHCPNCGFETEPMRARCPLCDSEIPFGERRPETGCPVWEDPRASFPWNAMDTWRESLVRPTEFFAKLTEGSPFSRPLLYYLLMAVTSAFFTLWWQAVGVTLEDVAPLTGELSRISPLVTFFLSPFVALGGLAVWTAFVHLFVVLLVPQRRGLGSTGRVLCYSSGPSVFTVIPIVGPLIGLVWGIVLQVTGIREVHRTTTGRATVAVLLLPMLLILLLGALLFILLVLAGLMAVEQLT